MSTELATTQKQVRVVEDSSGASHLLDTARFEHSQRIATLMARASLIPDHLRTSKAGPLLPETIMANCFLIVNQALQWGFDPFAVAPETYVVGGKLSYQGKLIAAVVNERARLKQRLNYSFAGTGENLTVTVSGTFEGEDEPRTCTLRLGDAKTGNDMWRKDPEQKLIYSGVTKWARRHCPEVILGVLTTDDAEKIAEGGEPTPQEQDAELHRLNVEAIGAYNARLRAQGQPESMMEPLPLPPSSTEDDEIPMAHGWRDVAIVGVSKLAGKKLGDLDLPDLVKLQRAIREMSPSQRSAKPGIHELLVSVSAAVSELTPKTEPPAKATPAEGLRNLMKASGVDERQVLAFIEKQNEGWFEALESVPADVIELVTEQWATSLPTIKQL